MRRAPLGSFEIILIIVKKIYSWGGFK